MQLEENALIFCSSLIFIYLTIQMNQVNVIVEAKKIIIIILIDTREKLNIRQNLVN